MSSNLTPSQMLPGVYGAINYNSQGSGQAPDNRVLLIGFQSSAAQRTPGQPYLPASQQDVDDGSGLNSDIRNMYAAAISQPEAQGANVWVLPIAENSGGTQGTYTLTVYGTPAKSGTLQLWINSQPVPAVGFTTSDTPTTIAAALAAAITGMKNLPLATAIAASAVVTLTYQHKGTTSEDLPMRCNITPNGTSVNLSPGQAVFATNATGAGSVSISLGALSVSTVLAGAETPAQVATKVAASWTAGTYPLTAVVDGSSTSKVDFYFTNNYDVRRMSAAVITSTGTTVNLGSGVTDGLGSASSTSQNGTVGTGLPSFTTALTNLGNLPPFRSWATAWNDATSLGTLATNIEASSDGSITGQKQQHLTFGFFGTASAAGTVLTTCSPNLTTANPHYAALWSPDVTVKSPEIAARIAAARAALWLGYPSKNWNTFQVRGNQTSPILLPPTTPSKDQLNTALRTYALAPVVVGTSGNLEVVKGRTTSLATDLRLWAWSSEAQAAFHEVDLAAFFQTRFAGGSIVRFSVPKAPGLFDANSFIDATKERMRLWEGEGNYDGADALAGAVSASPNISNPFRMDVAFPESPVLDLDQIVFTGLFTSVSQ